MEIINMKEECYKWILRKYKIAYSKLEFKWKGFYEEFFETKGMFLSQGFVEQQYSSNSGLSGCRIFYFEDIEGIQVSEEFDSWEKLFQYYLK